jgi:hypothetical protein
LRFRSDAISQLTGIPFKRVLVRKGIWFEGGFVQPNIRCANSYSRKVLGGGVVDRSVWEVDAAERWIAPEDFYDQLVRSVGRRISWGTSFVPATSKEPSVSTIPLPELLKALGMSAALVKEQDAFRARSITVHRFRVPGADVFQTIYFPGADTRVYRASITKDLLIVEVADPLSRGDALLNQEMDEVLFAFGLGLHGVHPVGTTVQSYGKIKTLDSSIRKKLLFEITSKHRIFCLGRYATMRNCMLDDLIQDVAVIRRMAHAGAYDLAKETF